jgi:hypothetical protein
MACLITGITPQIARDRGLPENEFAAAIHELMSQPDTCTVGFNNFRFDDEVTRHLFWRNFFDPYAREYANGNSRFDLIDVLRMTSALRPDRHQLGATRRWQTQLSPGRPGRGQWHGHSAGHTMPWQTWKPPWAWRACCAITSLACGTGH